MVLTVESVRVDPTTNSTSLLSRFCSLSSLSLHWSRMKPHILGSPGVLHVFAREFAVSHPLDRRVAILAADDITTSHVLVVRHTGSGATGLLHMDRIQESGITSLIDRIISLSFHFEGRLEAHVFGGYVDTSQRAVRDSDALLQCLKGQREEMELVHWCVGDNFLLGPNTRDLEWNCAHGLAVDIRTGDIFPASCLDKGPDLDIRTARTLAAGDAAPTLEIYDSSREELRIGPFTYGPVRSASLLLAQSDAFLLHNLCAAPSVAPPNFVSDLRLTLNRLKNDPYPSVTLFPNNEARVYRKDEHSGIWVRGHKEDLHWHHCTNNNIIGTLANSYY